MCRIQMSITLLLQQHFILEQQLRYAWYVQYISNYTLLWLGYPQNWYHNQKEVLMWVIA